MLPLGVAHGLPGTGGRGQSRPSCGHRRPQGLEPKQTRVRSHTCAHTTTRPHLAPSENASSTPPPSPQNASQWPLATKSWVAQKTMFWKERSKAGEAGAGCAWPGCRPALRRLCPAPAGPRRRRVGRSIFVSPGRTENEPEKAPRSVWPGASGLGKLAPVTDRATTPGFPVAPTGRGKAHTVLRREREYFNIKGKSSETAPELLSLGISKAGVPAPLCWRQRLARGWGRPAPRASEVVLAQTDGLAFLFLAGSSGP